MNPGLTAAEAYKAARFENAPPLKLVQLMYEGALRFIDQAETHHAAGEVTRYAERCMRAHAIVTELRLALDSSQAPELAENLHQLYLFAETELCRAAAGESSAPLGAARGVLATLLDGWKKLEVSP
ncbi:MAG: flagellar export chaperone FliS [Planctomycetota bacterium]